MPIDNGESRQAFETLYLMDPNEQRTKKELMATVMAYQYHVYMDDIEKRIQCRTGAQNIPEDLRDPDLTQWRRETNGRREFLFNLARKKYNVHPKMLQRKIVRASLDLDRHSMEWMREQLDHLWNRVTAKESENVSQSH